MIVPDSAKKSPKKEQVKDMFNEIAPTYDLLNHCLSFGIDRRWRREVVKMCAGHKSGSILDVASGTGDMAVAMHRLRPEKIVATDIAESMLDVARRKIAKTGLAHKTEFMVADAASLPFDDHAFDLASVAFGVRNFENPEAGLAEIARVLKPGGVLMVLEFSKLRNNIPGRFAGLYFKRILPAAGRIVSGNRYAYRYLHDTASQFPSGVKFARIMRSSGFDHVEFNSHTFGMVTIYKGVKY